MSNERTIYVISEIRSFRYSLMTVLGAAGFSVALYTTGSDFLKIASELSEGCILFVLGTHSAGAISFQEELVNLGNVLPLIFISGATDMATMAQVLRVGAMDFIEEPFEDDQLLDALEGVLPKRGPRMPHLEKAMAVERTAHLSPREREVLQRLVWGHSNKIIAYDLGLSIRTVEVHRARMLHRLGVHKTAQALRLAVLAELA